MTNIFTFDESIVSDLHKDARGYRPRGVWWEIWEESSDVEKQKIWDDLLYEVGAELEEERRREAYCIDDLNTRIQETIDIGAGDRDTAIRWLTTEEKFDNSQDVEHWLWLQGVLFTDFGRDMKTKLCQMYEVIY